MGTDSKEGRVLAQRRKNIGMKPLLLFLLMVSSPLATPSQSGEGELCDICIDLVTVLEEWITDETTADEIAAFVEQFCSALGPLASVCEGLIEANLPDLLANIAAGLPPYKVCSSVLDGCNEPTSTSPAPTVPSDAWFYLETALEGGRVLTTLAGDRYCNMQGKHENDDHQLWRLKADGCLTNKHHSDRCLEVEGVHEGASLGLHEANGQHSQQWTWTSDNYIESAVRGDTLNFHLVIDIEWADIPLITDGALVHAWHRDDSDSQKWTIVPA